MEEIFGLFQFSIFAININVLVDAAFNSAVVVAGCWDTIPAIASTNLLIEVLWSFGARLWLLSNLGNMVSRYSCLIMCCGSVGSR